MQWDEFVTEKSQTLRIGNMKLTFFKYQEIRYPEENYKVQKVMDKRGLTVHKIAQNECRIFCLAGLI